MGLVKTFSHAVKRASDPLFALSHKLEQALNKVSPEKLTIGSLVSVFAVSALAVQQGVPLPVVANINGGLASLMIFARQAGLKDAEAMKKSNIIRSNALIVQYGLAEKMTGVFANATSVVLNYLFLKDFGQRHKLKLSVAGAGVSTALSAPVIFNSVAQGLESGPLLGVFNGAVQSLPLLGSYLGIYAIAQNEGKKHRLAMGAGGALDLCYDLATQSWGSVVGRTSNVVGTVIGYRKHDRKPKSTPDMPAP